MSSQRGRRMREDRALRDAALALVKADIAHLRNDLGAKSIPSRVADRLGEGAIDVFEEAVEVADNNRGVIATLVAAVFIWFARNPVMALFDDEERNGDEQPDDDDEYSEPDEA